MTRPLSTALVISLATVPSASGQASFQGLGDLPGGDFVSRAASVSSDGSVVVGLSYSAAGGEAFRWTREDGMVGLGDRPGGDFSSQATAVSSDGSIIVGSSRQTRGREAIRWTRDGGLEGLGDLPGGGSGILGLSSFDSHANDVSADGSVVVGLSHSASGLEAFRWTRAEGMVGLGDLPGGRFDSRARGVSSDGSVIAGSGQSALGQEAFRWTSGGGMQGLGDLPGGHFNSNARGMSADGSVIVGDSSSAAGQEAFRWTQETGIVGLGVLPGSNSNIAWGVSPDGSTVVGSISAAGGGRIAFIWDEANGMRSVQAVLENEYGLDLNGWTLRYAMDVSVDHQTQTIVGRGYNPDGNEAAWIATIPRTEHPSSLRVTWEDGNITVSWTGGSYERLQVSTDLANWADIPGVDAMTDNSFTEPATARGRDAHYRLVKDE